MNGVRSIMKNDGLPIDIIKSENCRTAVFGDRQKWRKLSRDLGIFPEMIRRRKMFFDLSLFDIQICQIAQNNDLPI